jgi:cullin-5
MLDSWNNQIFMSIKGRLQSSAMKLVRAERNGEAFDSQLVIGVRESYGKIDNNDTSMLITKKGDVSCANVLYLWLFCS